MAWRLHLVQDRPRAGPDGQIPVGTMWPAKRGDEEGYCVLLPGGVWWWTYQHAEGGQGWQVTVPPEGPEHMTVSPSIDIADGWHGWIQNGVISDDVSGKQF